MKRFLLITITILIVFSFTSCRFSDKDNIIRYDIGCEPKTLDPQSANDEAGKIILSHVLEGLLVKDASGKFVEACAEKYTVSDDGLTYTFTLRPNLVWSNGLPLTSDDFLFAFTRIFLPETHAENINRYLCIKNAKEIYNGEAQIENLGIKTPDEKTLIIELEYPDASFLETLTLVSSLPCNREFFENSKGKYGVDYKNMIYNNRFVINDWKDNTYITLRPNNKYRDQKEIRSDGINFYTSADLNSKERFLDETTDLVLFSSKDIHNLSAEKFKTIELSCTTWALGFNQQNDIFKNKNLRTALALCMDGINVEPDNSVFSIADRIMPLALDVSDSPPALTSQESSFSLFKRALEELKLKSLPQITIVCPDYYDFRLYLTYLQKAWIDELGIAVNFEVLDEHIYAETLENGNFDMILFPLSANTNSPISVLNSFNSLSNDNYLHYNNSEYDLILEQASQQIDPSKQSLLFYEAEAHLIQHAVLYPIYHEKEYLALNNRIEDIAINPFGPEINFCSAYKK